LALSEFEPTEKVTEHVWLIDLDSGRRLLDSLSDPANGIGLEESEKQPERIKQLTESEKQLIENEGVIGCQLVAIVDDPSTPGGLRMVTVEELSGYRGLKQRLQLVTRSISKNQDQLIIGQPKVTPITASTRDESRVRYAATMNHQAGKTAVAVVYQSLDSKGREILSLESLMSKADGSFSRQSVKVEKFPTAMHIDREGRLYCGFADGSINECASDKLNAGIAKVANEHESAITVLSSTEEGKVVGGSADGVWMVFDQALARPRRPANVPLDYRIY
jgi:hypothetical protein